MKEQPKFKINDLVIDESGIVGEVEKYQWKDYLDMYVYYIKTWTYQIGSEYIERRENELETL